MASTSGSEPVEQSQPATREPSGSQDPAVLAKQIERTREDLAATLDAIADKVSPKRVAGRAREQLTVAAQGALATAKLKAGQVAATATALTSGGEGSHLATTPGSTTSVPGGAPSGVRPEHLAGGALGLLLLLWARRRRRARRLPRITAKDLARAQAHARALELAHARHAGRPRR